MIKTVKELVEKISIPNSNKIKQKNYCNAGLIPVVDQSSVLIGGYTTDINTPVKCDLPVIIFGDHTRVVKYIDFVFSAGADGIVVIKPLCNVNAKYLFYGIKHLVSKMPDLGYARHYHHLEKMGIPVPSLPEQERIVARIEELFAELDKSVAALKRAKEQVEEYKKAVLRFAFDGKYSLKYRQCIGHKKCLDDLKCTLDNIAECRKNCKNYELTENFTLEELPIGWKWIPLGNVSIGVEYGSSKKSLKSGLVPVVRMGNIVDGRITWNDLVYTDDPDEIIKYKLNDGDVLFNRTNSSEHVGKTGIFRGTKDAIFAGYLIRINQCNFVNSDYLCFYLSSPTAKQYSNVVKTDAVNQSNINGQKLCGYPFPLCSLEEQKFVVKEIRKHFLKASNLNHNIKKILTMEDLLRQSILKKAFEGEL